VNKTQQIRFLWKPLVFLLALAPALYIVYPIVLAYLGGPPPSALGANPVEALLDHFGNWSLRFLMIGLAVTPARKLLGWPSLARFRRMLGLFGFFYVLMHFLIWLILDQGLYLGEIVEDIALRPFITIGFAALVILTAMAATSFSAARRAMGRRWQQLHYGAYAAGILGVWHYWWQVKADISEPLIYAAILTALLGYRIANRLKGNRTVTRPARAT